MTFGHGLLAAVAFCSSSIPALSAPGPVERTFSDVIGVSLVNSARILDAVDGCPADSACFLPSTIVTLELDLTHCANRIGHIAFESRPQESGTLNLYLSAVELHTTESQNSVCFAPHSVIESIVVPGIRVNADDIVLILPTFSTDN